MIVDDRNIPKSVENSLIDMKEGETKTIALEPAEAFSPKIDNLIIEFPKEGFDPQIEFGVKEGENLKKILEQKNNE